MPNLHPKSNNAVYLYLIYYSFILQENANDYPCLQAVNVMRFNEECLLHNIQIKAIGIGGLSITYKSACFAKVLFVVSSSEDSNWEPKDKGKYNTSGITETLKGSTILEIKQLWKSASH